MVAVRRYWNFTTCIKLCKYCPTVALRMTEMTKILTRKCGKKIGMNLD